MKVEMCASCRGHGKILVMLPSTEAMETFCPDCEGEGLAYSPDDSTPAGVSHRLADLDR